MSKISWVLDPAHSEIGFKVKHMMITNVKGKFDDFDIKVETEGEDFSNPSVELKVNLTSVNTSNEQRDAHLRSSDFFEVAQYPYMVFKSTKTENSSNDFFTMFGDLTIKNITKEVKLNVENGGILKDPWGNLKAGFTITGKLNRKDWGLVWNAALEAGGVLVGDDVNLLCEFELQKPA